MWVLSPDAALTSGSYLLRPRLTDGITEALQGQAPALRYILLSCELCPGGLIPQFLLSSWHPNASLMATWEGGIRA